MNLNKAMELAMNTDYACESAHQDINPINKGDAGAFFLEGYKKGIKDSMSVCDNAWNDARSECNMKEHAINIKAVISGNMED